MKTIIKPRGGGKTEELLKLANNFNGYIVVATLREADLLHKRAKNTGYKINLPITYHVVVHDVLNKNCSPIFIDNAEHFVNYVVSNKYIHIGAITVSTELYPERTII